MSAWLLARGKGEDQEFFTGKVKESGQPRVTPFRSDGFHFSSARAAYEAAETHTGLRGSEQWRVVRR